MSSCNIPVLVPMVTVVPVEVVSVGIVAVLVNVYHALMLEFRKLKKWSIVWIRFAHARFTLDFPLCASRGTHPRPIQQRQAHVDFSLRTRVTHFDRTSISLRFHFDLTSTSLGKHFALTSGSPRYHFDFT